MVGCPDAVAGCVEAAEEPEGGEVGVCDGCPDGGECVGAVVVLDGSVSELSWAEKLRDGEEMGNRGTHYTRTGDEPCPDALAEVVVA